MRLWRTTKHENRVQRASYVETGQSVIQASVVGGSSERSDARIPPGIDLASGPRLTLTLTHYGRKTGKPHEVTIWFVLDGEKF